MLQLLLLGLGCSDSWGYKKEAPAHRGRGQWFRPTTIEELLRGGDGDGDGDRFSWPRWHFPFKSREERDKAERGLRPDGGEGPV